MDLSKELLKIKEKQGNLDMVLDKAEKEKELSDKKLHIFQRMAFITRIKEITPMLIEEGVVNLRVTARISDKGPKLELSGRRKNIEERVDVRNEKDKFLPWFISLYATADNFILNNLLTESFQNMQISNPQYINLKDNIEEQLYKVLLNKELKTVLDYNVLNLKLENKEKKLIKVKTNKI